MKRNYSMERSLYTLNMKKNSMILLIYLSEFKPKAVKQPAEMNP